MRKRAKIVSAFAAVVLTASGAALSAMAQGVDGPAPQPAGRDVARMSGWVVRSGDNAGLPFAIVDKLASEIFLFTADGRALGSAPALLGAAHGDDSVPGIGDRPLSSIRPAERTTPAGRFIGGYGPASRARTVLWIDFDTAVSLHAVVTANPKERRLERLASPTPKDNRITYGCINVAADFYEDVVRRNLMATKTVFYILPEAKPISEVFPTFWAEAQATTDLASSAAAKSESQPIR